MITKPTIDRIMEAIDIVEVVGEFVQLKKRGANYVGLSPFANERTPSFTVSPAKGIFKDFSSGKGGSAVTFLMELEKFTYPEALKWLAKKYGIEVEETDGAITRFTFTGEVPNAAIPADEFHFTAPPGVPVVDAAAPV